MSVDNATSRTYSSTLVEISSPEPEAYAHTLPMAGSDLVRTQRPSIDVVAEHSIDVDGIDTLGFDFAVSVALEDREVVESEPEPVPRDHSSSTRGTISTYSVEHTCELISFVERLAPRDGIHG